MELHYSKHHQAYVNGLNAAEEAYAKAPSTYERITLQPALKFNGGGKFHPPPSYFSLSLTPHIGHINHSLFWKNLAPVKQGGGQLKDGKLKAALERDFGSVDAFKKAFNATTAGIQGSGWGWLGYSAKTKKLEIVTTTNQDPLLCACCIPLLFLPLPAFVADWVFKAHVPIIGVDIWEHVRDCPPLILLPRYSCSRFM